MENENNNPAGAPQQQEQPAQQAERTFTQAELDTIVARRLAKAQRGMPDEVELTAFRAWKDSQQTEQQRMNTLTQERDTARNDLAAANAKVEQYEREKLMLAKGIPADDVDYYVFKAGQMVSDTKTFEQAADEVIKARPPQTVRVDFGAPLNSGGEKKTSNDAMNALIRGARK